MTHCDDYCWQWRWVQSPCGEEWDNEDGYCTPTLGICFPPFWQHYCRSLEQWGDGQEELFILFTFLFAHIIYILFLLSFWWFICHWFHIRQIHIYAFPLYWVGGFQLTPKNCPLDDFSVGGNTRVVSCNEKDHKNSLVADQSWRVIYLFAVLFYFNFHSIGGGPIYILWLYVETWINWYYSSTLIYPRDFFKPLTNWHARLLLRWLDF